jgi:Na+/melibiose symporter-like transporter
MPDAERDESVSIKQLDFLGAGLMCGAVCCLMVAITKFKDFGKNFGQGGVAPSVWIMILVFFVAFLVLAALFVWRVRTAEHPIVDREVLFNKKFSSVTAFFFLYGFVALGMAQMIPTFAQKVYGFSSDMAAAVVMVKGIGWFLVGLVVAALIKKLGYRIPLLICIGLIAGSYLVMAITSVPDAPIPETAGDYLSEYLWLFVVAVVLGAGSGMAAPTMTNCAVDLMPQNVGTIYGVTAAFRQIGSTLCIPIVTVIIALFGDSYAMGFRVVYLVMTAAILACLAFVFKMPKAPRFGHVAPRRH